MTSAGELKVKGLRPTPRRLALVDALKAAKTPKTVDELRMRLKDVDLVTIYRNLQLLVEAGLVREVRFKDASVRYELAGGEHHHHLVCTSCGKVDELEGCNVSLFEKKALRQTERFATINEHSLEFFGTCVACARVDD